MENVTLYSSEGCPRCNVLKQKLHQHNIQYTNIMDTDLAIKNGIDEVPVLVVDGVMMKFADANRWVNKVGGA